jgi:deazaflavin-dependent oxidoreductase (nitroreductase family)
MTTNELQQVTTPRPPPKVPPSVNATMRWILRSPISRLVDRGIVLLTVTGRRTGRRFSFPVQYVEVGDTLWIMSGAGPEKTWWRNLVGGAPIRVLLRRHPYEGVAEVATYDVDPATVEEGVRRYAARFPRFARKLGIDQPEAFEAHARNSVIVRIDLDR